jgi:two-component SAPR family response regulator
MARIPSFPPNTEIRRLDKKVKICFLTAGEMYCDAYSDIFSSLPSKYFIRKPIENEELIVSPF